MADSLARPGTQPRTRKEPGAWVFHPDRALIGCIAALEADGQARLRMYDRQGIDVGETTVTPNELQPWRRVRKPIFPVPATCLHLGDVMLPDYDYPMCQAQFERVLATPRLLDAQAYLRFHASRGYSRGESVALGELVDALDTKYGCQVQAHPFVMALEDYLLLSVRPRGTALALLADEYPLDVAVQDWVRERARAHQPAQAPAARPKEHEFVRDRSYV